MSETKQFHTTTSEWSDNIETVLKNIGDSCIGYKWMNIFAAKKASIRYNIFMYLIMSIGPISGILSAISAPNQDYDVAIRVIVTVFSFVSGVVSAILKFSKFDQISNSHKSIAAKYASLEGNIRRQLSLNRNDRVNAGEYLDWVSMSFDDLFSSVPLMSESIYQEWVKFAQNNNITVPKEIEHLVNDTHTGKLEQLCSVRHIEVNKNEPSESPSLQLTVSQTELRKRGDGQNALSDLNRYADGRMRYEMRRLFGI